MTIDYGTATDTLRVVLKDTPVRESEEERSGVILDYSGVILDYDASGHLVVLDAVQLSIRQRSRASRAAE